MRSTVSILFMAATLFVTAPFVSSCVNADPQGKEQEKEEEDPQDEPQEEPGRKTSFDGTYYHDLPLDAWEESVLKRADVMLNCPWTPLKDVKQHGGSAIYPAGITVQPIPYGGTGSTAEYYTYVGLSVSFYTFLSCVNNPKSNFYDSAIWESFGRPFYGTVCTTFTAYCWGLPSAINTDDVYNGNTPYLKEFTIKNLSDLQLTDGLCWWKAGPGGHMLILTDIARDKDGNTKKITTTEANGGRVHSEEYTIEEFQSKIDNISVPMKYYRYEREKYGKYLGQPAFVEQERVSGYTFPDALCGNRGDKVSYALGTPVVINILSDKYSKIELYKDEVLYQTRDLDGTKDVTFNDLPVGMYKARLIKDTSASSYTYFQIGEVSFTAKMQDGKVVIKYNDPNSEIQFLTTNQTDNTGSVRRYVERVRNGEYTYSWPLVGATNIRVHFAGKYSTYRGNSVKISQ